MLQRGFNPGGVMRSFLQELQRRNVYKIGAMYAVGGWLVVQVATSVLPIFAVSALALRVIVLVVVAGFPVALVLSWIYELTPNGIARTSAIAPEQSITRHTGQKLNWVITGVLAIAVAFLLAQRYWLKDKPTAAGAAVTERSVAVLPFESLSDEKANAYFASGIQDEILTRLAKIGALKVISRTSTQHYASSPDNLPEIAKQLGVANILEGSVQKVGDAVHINVQLIRAATDEHLWAEVYNRKLEDIFAVEAEVAGAIADALNATLSGTEHAAVTNRPTENLAAYDAYLRGRALDSAGYDFATSRKLAAAYAEAVRLDPKFALAWANLATSASYLYFNNVDTDKYDEQFIKNAADTAMRLQPQLPEVQLVQGDYLYRIKRDFAGAQRVYEEILRKYPNDRAALQYLGLVERRQGKWEQAITHLQQASQLDPRNAGLLTTIGGETYSNMRRFDEAHEWLRRALAISPDDALAIAYEGSAYMGEGRLADAARIYDSIPSAGIDPGLASFRAWLRLLQHDYPLAISEVEAVLARPEGELNGFGAQLRVYLGTAQVAGGQKAQAQATFEDLIRRYESLASQRDDSLVPISLTIAYAYAGRHKEAIAQGQRAIDVYRDDALQRPAAELAMAQAQALGGDADAAIAALEGLLKVPSTYAITPALLRLDPSWDALRGNPRFEPLLKTDAIAGSGPH